MQLQVSSDHYNFSGYVRKRRWSSIWHQLAEVVAIGPQNVLEVGPGPGVFKAVGELFIPVIRTIDLDSALVPDYVASANAMPFREGTFDVVCAFQVLEHAPYESTLRMFSEMARVAKKALVISLPDARPLMPFSFNLPLKGDVKVLLPKPWMGPRRHVFDGQHFWELNKKGFVTSKVVRDLEGVSERRLVKRFRVPENPYHHFFVFE